MKRVAFGLCVFHCSMEEKVGDSFGFAGSRYGIFGFSSFIIG